MLLLMVLVKFELVFVIIMGIRKHMVTRPDRKISSAIFYCGLTMRMTWPLVWLDRLVVAWSFTEEKYCRRDIQNIWINTILKQTCVPTIPHINSETSPPPSLSMLFASSWDSVLAQDAVLLLFQYAATLSRGKGPDLFL